MKPLLPSPGAPPASRPVQEDAWLATIGLPVELGPLVSWAHGLGLSSPVFVLLDACRGAEFPAHVGAVIGFLRRPHPNSLLTQWQAENDYLPELCELTRSISLHPAVLRHYPPAPPGIPTRKKLKDLLNKLPLVALLMPQPPHLEDPAGSRDWLEALQTWCLVQFLDAASQGNYPNPYLITIASKLRLGIEHDPVWRDLFIKLMGNTGSFHALTSHLQAAADALLSALPATDEKTSTRRSLLSNLKSFCAGDAPPIKLGEINESHSQGGAGLYRTFIQRLRANAPPFLDNVVMPEPDEVPPPGAAVYLGSQNHDSSSGASQLHILEVSESDTPAEQERKARGVLLASVENQQYLSYSWMWPNPEERRALKAWLATTLQSADVDAKTLACLVWLGIQTSSSLRTVLRLRLDDQATDDWCISIAGGFLLRRPPRRYNGWTAKGEAMRWVTPLADQIKLALPAPVAKVLSQLQQQAPTTSHLGGLFSPGTTAEQQFRVAMSSIPALRRVTSGMLAHVMAIELHENTQDSVLTQLLTSQPRTGLPGHCAYSSYSHRTVNSELTRCLGGDEATPPEADDKNATGSQLDPIEALLSQACKQAMASVDATADNPAAWVAHHNALTTYVVLVLLAATAGRPVTSPFESADWIDLEAMRIFVKDKVASTAHVGRLIPLPRQAKDAIQQVLQPHLVRLSAVLANGNAAMSQEVGKLARLESSDKLPLFFYLAADPHLSWVEVSEATMSAMGIFRWPLPWNLMRHRTPTRLKRMGVDHEVIDGLMDHGDHGTNAYGPYSNRCWRDDETQAAPALNELMQQLSLGLPQTPRWEISQAARVPIPPSGCALSGAPVFGAAARAELRQRTHANAKAKAIADIERFVGQRPLDSLSPADWETLSKSMLINDRGMPMALGSVRYEALQSWIKRHWEATGQRPRMKRRYLPSLEEVPPFNEYAIGAGKNLLAARRWLDEFFTSFVPTSAGRRESLVWAALSLLIHSRVSDHAVLDDILSCRNIQLVLMDSGRYLEHGAGLDRDHTAPRKRYRITLAAAWCIDHAMTSRTKIEGANSRLPPRANGLCVATGIQLGGPLLAKQLVKTLAKIVHQANAIDYPRIVSAFLSGEIVTAGLDHADLLRCLTGQAFHLPAAAEPTEDARDSPGADSDETDDDAQDLEIEASGNYLFAANALANEATAAVGAAAVAAPDDSEGLRKAAAQKAARTFFSRIREAITQAGTQKHSPRRDLDRAIGRLVAQELEASRTCRLLGEWTRSLLWRRKGRKDIRLSSVQRYLSALSPCFEAVAYEHDLLSADEEEVTRFYADVMAARASLHPHTASAETPTPDGTEPARATGEYKTWSLALQLLRDFHRLMHREAAVEDPDWSEIVDGESLLSISPGFLLERDYQCALSRLVHDVPTATREQLGRAFILLCSVRFGLRGSECTGLMREDWHDVVAQSPVVLVQSNKVRELKTPAGRRQVPLLFKLSATEKQIIKRFLSLWEGMAMGNQQVPLFGDPLAPTTMLNIKMLRMDVSSALKDVTGNPATVLHHGRHTFACRVGMMLFNDGAPLWPHAGTVAGSETSYCESSVWRSHVRRLLLSTAGTTRRSAWALARLMGHAHPRTAFRSYVHFLPELAERAVWGQAALEPHPEGLLFKNALNLQALEPLQDYLAPRAIPTAPVRSQPLTLEGALSFLYLHQGGKLEQDAALASEVELRDAQHLVELVQTLDQILGRHEAINPRLGGKTNLLGHLRSERWKALRAWARTLPPPSPAPAFEGIHWKGLVQDMVGPSRQLLLWKREHFAVFACVARGLEFPLTHFRFISAERPHEALQRWAHETRMPKPTRIEFVRGQAMQPDTPGEEAVLRIAPAPRTPTRKPGRKPATSSVLGKKVFQVDAVLSGDPPLQVKHRVAVLPIFAMDTEDRTAHSSTVPPKTEPMRLESTYEFIILFCVQMLVLGAAHPDTRPTPGI